MKKKFQHEVTDLFYSLTHTYALPFYNTIG